MHLLVPHPFLEVGSCPPPPQQMSCLWLHQTPQLGTTVIHSHPVPSPRLPPLLPNPATLPPSLFRLGISCHLTLSTNYPHIPPHIAYAPSIDLPTGSCGSCSPLCCLGLHSQPHASDHLLPAPLNPHTAPCCVLEAICFPGHQQWALLSTSATSVAYS